MGTKEAAEILGVERSTLSKWVRAGKVEVVGRIGQFGRAGHGALIFDAEALEMHPLRRTSEQESVAQDDPVGEPLPVGSSCGGEASATVAATTA